MNKNRKQEVCVFLIIPSYSPDFGFDTISTEKNTILKIEIKF